MSYYRGLVCGVLSAALAFLFGVDVRAQVLPPDATVGGLSMAEWQVESWRWVLETPADINPAADTTGEFSHTGDRGSVFLVNGTFGGPTITRTAIVRDEQHIFVGLLNSVFWSPPPTEAELRALVTEDVDTIDQLFLEIDGIAPGVNLFDYRIPSPPGLFELTLPENNVAEIPLGVYPAVSDGYSVMLEPLTRGSHTLAFGGRFADADGNETFSSSVIYDVTVVPEPSSFGLLAASLLGLVALVRKRLR